MNFDNDTYYTLQVLVGVVNQARRLAETMIQSVEDLLLAEEFLDAVDAGIVGRDETYGILLKQSLQYLRDHLEIVAQPWVRNAGSVYDMAAAIRDELNFVVSHKGSISHKLEEKFPLQEYSTAIH